LEKSGYSKIVHYGCVDNVEIDFEGKVFMNVLKYLRDVVSGRIKHRNRTEGVVINELWSTVENLEKTHVPIFQSFIVSAGHVAEWLIWPEEKTEANINIDIKKIGLQQVRQLYFVLLSYFIFMFSYHAPLASKEKLKKALFEVTNQSNLAKAIFQDLSKTGVIDSYSVESIIWGEIVKILGSGDKRDPIQLVAFGMVLSGALSVALKEITEELNA
jgi:hypothetical protein